MMGLSRCLAASVFVAICLSGTSHVWAQVDAAEVQALQTGQPLLVVIGRPEQLTQAQQAISRDAALQRVVSQFLTVTAVHPGPDAEKALGKWLTGGGTITFPFYMAVRADGHVLGTGATILTVPTLTNYLAQSGTFFSVDQLRVIEADVERAQALLQEGKKTDAMRLMAKYASLTTYSQAAGLAISLAERFVSEGNEQFESATQKLHGSEALNGAVALAELSRTYGVLPPIKQRITEEIASLRRDKALRDAWTLAQSFDKAAESAEKGQPDRAITQYRQIISQNANTEAEALALRQLALLKAQGVDVGNDLELPEVDALEVAPQAQGFVGFTKAASWVRLANAYKASDPARAREYAERALAAQGADGDGASQAAAQTILDELK
jgi:hypothetical protein